jgi:hypothetical protein
MRILVDPTEIGRSGGRLFRYIADIGEVSYRGLAGGGHADHGATVGPSGDDDWWRGRADRLSDLERIVGQPRGRGSVRGQVRGAHLQAGAFQELSDPMPIVRVAPETVKQHGASPDG